MSDLPAAVTLATTATETASDVASALAPVLEGFSWWSAVAAVLTWAILAAPVIDKAIDILDRIAEGSANTWDNRAMRFVHTVWRWVKALAGGLTRRKK